MEKKRKMLGLNYSHKNWASLDIEAKHVSYSANRSMSVQMPPPRNSPITSNKCQNVHTTAKSQQNTEGTFNRIQKTEVSFKDLENTVVTFTELQTTDITPKTVQNMDVLLSKSNILPHKPHPMISNSLQKARMQAYRLQKREEVLNKSQNTCGSFDKNRNNNNHNLSTEKAKQDIFTQDICTQDENQKRIETQNKVMLSPPSPKMLDLNLSSLTQRQGYLTSSTSTSLTPRHDCLTSSSSSPKSHCLTSKDIISRLFDIWGPQLSDSYRTHVKYIAPHPSLCKQSTECSGSNYSINTLKFRTAERVVETCNHLRRVKSSRK